MGKFLSLFDITLLFRSLWQHRSLMHQLVVRNISQRYKGAFLGFFWNFIQPLMMLCVYTFVFSFVFKARGWGGVNTYPIGAYPVIMFCGIATYNLFSDGINSSCNLIVSNPNFVKKVIFPLEILVAGQVLAVFLTGILWFLLVLAGFRYFWKDITGVPNGLETWSQRIVLLWGLLLLVWRPELLLRTLTFILCNTFYRLRLENAERLPDYGPALIVSNHVSFLDALFIMGLKARKVTILVHSNFYRMKGFKWFFRWIGALEVPKANQPKQMQKFLDRVHKVLNRGGVVCMFPEGSISGNGVMQEFKCGVKAMLPSDEVPVIPMHLSMLWGSLFRIHRGHLRFIKPHKLPIPATVYVGEPIPGDWSGFRIWQKIGELGAEAEMPLIPGEKTIHHRFLKRAKQHPLQITFADSTEKRGVCNLAVLTRAVLLSKKFRAILKERSDEGENMGIMLSNGTMTAAAARCAAFSARTTISPPAASAARSAWNGCGRFFTNSSPRALTTSIW